MIKLALDIMHKYYIIVIMMINNDLFARLQFTVFLGT